MKGHINYKKTALYSFSTTQLLPDMIIVILTPLLMLTDYFLTLVGKKYRDRLPYVRSETYELNPDFRKAIDNNEKFSFTHLAYTGVYTFLSFMLYEQGDKIFLEGFTGYIAATFGLINARHIGNILTFRFSIKNPEEVKGVVYTSHLYNLKNSLFQTIALAMAFLLFVILHPVPFLIGAFVSQVVLAIHQLLWINKHINSKSRLGENWVRDKAPVSDTTNIKI